MEITLKQINGLLETLEHETADLSLLMDRKRNGNSSITMGAFLEAWVDFGIAYGALNMALEGEDGPIFDILRSRLRDARDHVDALLVRTVREDLCITVNVSRS